ncbi:hypothetical protein [Anaerostipes sp. PC18]|uniref:hypothetical protein n=1 Tax=Anaerostipes sp. PC18 TaxID=3036926 RepID=UPI003091B328|nr:hypothetical protein P8F77_10250 [Anaerostipes sp. PC18]
MRIREVNDEHILFDNGKEITFYHFQDCCEYNYADFKQLEKLALETEFTEPIEFEKVEGAGFRFGNNVGKMFFVPCYSDQNGCYSSDIDIFYAGEKVLNLECEEAYYC